MSTSRKWLLAMAVLCVGSAVQAATIFHEDFEGTADVSITGTAPDVGSGTWGGWTDSVKLNGDGRGKGTGWDYAIANVLAYDAGSALDLSVDVGVGLGDDTVTMLQLNPAGDFWSAAAIVYLRSDGRWGINSSAGFSDPNPLVGGTTWNAAATAWAYPTASEMNNVHLLWDGVDSLSITINGVTQTSVTATLPTITSVAIARAGGGLNTYENLTLETVPEPTMLGLVPLAAMLLRRRSQA